MSMYETRLPKQVGRDQIKAACEALGIDAQDAKRICIEPKKVTVEVFLRDEDGRRHLACASDDDTPRFLAVRETIQVVGGAL